MDPKGTVSMDELADRLFALKMVQEIFLDDHEQGY